MRLLVTLLSLAFFGSIAVAIAFIAGIQYFSQDLPDYSNLADYEPPILTRFHAADGRMLAEYATERRVFVPYDVIPDTVKYAFIAAEDKDFFTHKGVDFNSIIRAGLQNLKEMGSGRRPIGASTITQQVARNFFLTNEVSYTRKIREILLAFRLERAISKERILELYLNQIFLGERSYGVAAAALNYFNKPLDELTIEEAAYLAALPKGPNNYSPVKYKQAAIARRNWVIQRMQEDGRITAAQAEEAQKKDLVTAKYNDGQTVTADYFAEEVRRELVEKFGNDAVLQGGLYVRTSLDPEMQAAADKALRDGLEAYDRRHGYRGVVAQGISFANWPQPLDKIAKPAGAEAWELAAVVNASAQAVDVITRTEKGMINKDGFSWAMRGDKPPFKRGDVILVLRKPQAPETTVNTKDGKKTVTPSLQFVLKQVPAVQGALVALDPHTGRVMAMSGGFSAKISQFNRATQAQRQPGSSFKPFVYLAALDNGFTPSSLVLDGPFEYNQGPGLPIWRPENYSQQFYGPTPLRVGIEKSRNVMTVRLAYAVGMDKIAKYSEKFGINDHMPNLLSMSLGAIETTPLRLTTAYAMIVNGGKKITPSFIDMVQDRRGHTVWRQQNRACAACVDLAWSDTQAVPEIPDNREQVQDPRTAAQMVSILEGVVQRGTAASLKKQLNFPVGGKTGTTNEARDAWFVGFAPDLAVGVYIGFDEPKSLGGHETGATAAVPVWGDFMEVAMKDKPAIPFRVPEGLRMVRVDPATGAEVEAGTPGAIWEGFIPGTEPSAKPQTVLDGSAPLNPNAEAEGTIVEDGDAGADIAPEVPAATVEGMSTPAGELTPTVNMPPAGDTPTPPRPAAPAPAATQGTGGLY